MGKKWKSKKRPAKIDIEEILRRQTDQRKLFEANKTEVLIIRLPPGMMDYLRDQGSMSKHVFKLIRDDMLDNWPE